MSRPYQKSLDFEIEYITVASLKKDDIGETILLHDQRQKIARWTSVSIYEDLFKNFMTCEVTLHDQDGMYLNRLRTEEVMVIKFYTPDLPGRKFEPRTHYFYVYKIDPVIVIDSPPGAVYTIKGISFEYFYSTVRTFSRSYRGKTSEIAEQIYKEYLLPKSEKTVKKQFKSGRPTKHEMKFTFPYVNAVDAINYLASVSIDSQNPDICNYVFFENKDGFNFISITELIEKPRKKHKYTMSPIPTSPDKGEDFFDFTKHFDKPIRVTPLKTGDKIVDTLDGVWGEYFVEYDMLYKSYTPYVGKIPGEVNESYGKRYLEYFPKTKHLNPVPLLAKENDLFKYPLGRNRVCLTNKALYSEKVPLEDGTTGDRLYETHEGEYSFQRRSMMQQINSFSIELEVPGNSEITIGDIVELDALIYRSSDKDLYLSGKYLVTGVHHFMTLSNYQTIMVISRDSIITNEFKDESEPGE